MVNYFIKRPVFATVCAIIILLIGAVSIPTLPIAQYPDISPTQINVTASYIGADAETVEKAVTTVLEREINGVEGMRYISSNSSNNGISNIVVTFDSSRDKDIAAVDVQNRVSLAEPQLPEEVRQTGVVVSKQNSNILLAMSLFSEDGTFDNVFLSNYADLYIVDALRRVPGVGDVVIFGERTYAMRLWLDPQRLASRDLTADDVVDALQEQNIQVGAGQLGQPPTPNDQTFQIDLRAVSRLQEVSEFEELVVQTGENGALVKLKDVGRAELGAESYSTFLRFRGNESVGLGIFQLPGSNALQVAQGVKEVMAGLSDEFPGGMEYGIGFDTTEFVEQSLSRVVWTLVQAVALVVLVIYLFLQDWRTTVIPAITIPVALIGTFAIIKIFGFSINSLTLFGLTLATGMVVDDAIVVVEDIASKIQDRDLPPKRAAIESMRELTGAVIATSLVLMAVFIPVAFFPGTTGALYRQFALTIAFAIALSTFNALTLTPTLAGLLLRQNTEGHGWLDKIFVPFNRFLDNLRNQYGDTLRILNRFKIFVLAAFVASLVLTGWLYNSVPSAFLPDEDQGYFITLIQGPEGTSLNQTSQVMRQVEETILAQDGVRATFAVGGFGFSGNTANNGVVFTTLVPWEERPPGVTSFSLIGQLFGQFSGITEARVFPVNPPSIQGLSSFSGFQFQLQDRRGTLSVDSLVQNMFGLLGAANQESNLQAVFSTYAANSPLIEIDVDRDKAKSLDVDISDIFGTLQTYLGSRYVNDFTLQGRTYRVYVQADQQYRSAPDDINKLYVKSNNDVMIPMGNLVTLTETTGAQTINHYNLFRSIEINGQAAPGVSSGVAIDTMEEVAGQVLPASLGYEWTGSALEEIEGGSQAPIIFGLGIVFVFLVLAAQYESYVDPVIILFAVPLAVFGALLAQSMRGLPNDVYCQIGLVMLIGLASKNSILIVEFANQLRDQGLSITKAAMESAQSRMRPILMTAISTLSSIFPLVIATGAGAGSRQSLGTAVFGGMFVATFLSLFVVPILYIVVKNLSEQSKPPTGSDDDKDDQLTAYEREMTGTGV
ncbi:efflux RND transporter permease subunit [Leptolyngbya cf. ectocarpi LEGE 11479]|uniref:Efflux RND transporter permease subunit n=1 Tax=Leptolyngbya cf. ectocarpi LEGE 11479 TaxID=1828722 RepID=A0A928ZTP3_LEPEC|nr:efflux RND transporter permease subunit [Leptolyngbya ectocarpi]MBE9066524.1 efflux RND transporter permease subunit [Leptolyngbya cf. ectocarpi LEGE 11479]